MITKELLEGRIAELTARQTALLADLNALGGALQDCQFWLNYLAKEVPQEIEDPPTS